MTDESGPPQITFIVRVSTDRTGVIAGVVERVRTGEKARFQGLEALGALIATMAAPSQTEGPEPSGERSLT
jgi:hypothetical protein